MYARHDERGQAGRAVPPSHAARRPSPPLLTDPEHLLMLQRAAGNSAVVQMLAGQDSPGPATPVQRVIGDTSMAVQQGPSCALYVMEALGNAHGLDTTAFSIAIRAYPGPEDVDRMTDQYKQQTGGRAPHDGNPRLQAMKTITQTLDRVVGELTAWQADSPGERRTIRRDQVLELVTRASPASAATVDKLRFADDVADTSSIIDAYREAAHRALSMAELAARAWIRSRHGEKKLTYWQEMDRALLNTDSEPSYIERHHTEDQVFDVFDQHTLPAYVEIHSVINVTTALPTAFVDMRFAKTVEYYGETAEVQILGRGDDYVQFTVASQVDPEFAVHIEDFREMAGENADAAVGTRVQVSRFPKLVDVDLDDVIIDLTQCGELQYVPASHALLVTRTENQMITYKDPNYGNAELRITADQMRKMAGTAPAEYGPRAGAVQVVPFRPPAPGEESLLGRRV